MNKELENILIKVGDLYNKYGIKSVTMDDVARELGISKKTLYQFVENKGDLVSKVLKNTLSKNNCTFKEIDEKNQNAIDELLEVGKHIVKIITKYNHSLEYDLKKYYPLLYDQIHEMRKEKMYNSILNNILKGKKEGLYRSDMNEEIITKIQTSRFVHMSSGELFDPEDINKPQYILELFIYHIRGIATIKGIDVLEKKLLNTDIQEYLQ
ncbi:MAG: TetR family transcriptional regulator [Bacteroidales bacterium]|nr:TetR family transcriptional regulator [Bacteroidales bacterium]